MRTASTFGIIAAAAVFAHPAQAQDARAEGDKPDMWVLVGGGIRSAPSYPGSGTNEPGFFPEIEVWRDGETISFNTPDEGLGPSLIGDRGKAAAGISVVFAPSRSADDVPGLEKVGFGIEAGGFAEAFLTPAVRARGELRQGIGSHGSLVGDVMLDALFRSGGGRLVATVGPRVRWASAGYNREFFGVDADEALASGLPAYRPGSGLYAVGAATGAHYFLSDSFGLYGFARYDRLVGDAADSPIIARGSRDQFSTGVALTYRFRIKR